MRKLEVIAAIIITIATIVILNTCSGNFQAPPLEEEVGTENTLQ